MATIIETSDTSINAHASGSLPISVGDSFSGTMSPSDTSDGINLTGMTIGETYTVSVDLGDLSGTSFVTVINHADFHSINYYVTDGVLIGVDEWTRSFLTSANARVEGTSIVFDFTPLTSTSFALQINGNGTNLAYDVTFEVAADPINEITGTADKDTLTGTDGADLANLDDGDDRFLAGEGNDIVNGGDGKDRLAGNAGDDTMHGGAGDDQMHGGSGADELIGGAGRDKLIGGGGNDVITGGAGNDHLRGNSGEDTMDGGNNNDRLFGGDGNDVMTAGQGNDKMWGEDGNDNMSGGVGHDVVKGGAGNDTIDGGAGRDKLEGGADADVFVFGPGAGRDIIVDFEDGVDQIDLSAYGFTDITDLTFVSMGDAVRVYTDGADSFLMRDTDVADLGNDDFIWA
ncbi:Leukotoxin [Ascidiaceihabitans donghaensis]|uniref:Leukotoxin n=1 Tax=Ascidiaceihabitans donghaensis TaxID=1510460 RepID=A0A2R8B9P1_9RHOB|nr:calcium-binding protein [Ascidiaceihabitans donghaensis]SPH19771.1 Leukotoxin [Ascidiaceihabitans donghaensis]